MVEREYVLELKSVTKQYGDFILDRVSFAVPKGCICGFIGQNGAGKTTTIQLILDIVNKDSGTIRVFGQDMKSQGKTLKERIGVVYDEMGFHEFLTADEINTIMKNIYENWQEEVFFDYLKRFSLPRKKRCGSFSRGMRMKLQIAAALSHEAELLIMDEPTSGLDPIVRNEILQIFQEFVMEENHTILLSSHITGDLERIADMVVFIDHGRIILSGNKDELLESHCLVKCKKEDVGKIPESDVVSILRTDFRTEILVKTKNASSVGKTGKGINREENDGMLLEQPTLEEIMIFYANRFSQEMRA